MTNNKIFVSGSSGYIGKNLCCELDKAGIDYSKSSRKKSIKKDDLQFNLNKNLSLKLNGYETVIHLAGIAHNKNKDKNSFYKINYEGTVNLAEIAYNSGVRRFIFISTIGVNGQHSKKPFKESDMPNPTNDYAKSKYLAEQWLLKKYKGSSMEVVIIRPPLIYSDDAPGNYKKLKDFLTKYPYLPIPFFNNKRNFCSIKNLIDLILLCIDLDKSKNAANQLFLVADDDEISTNELIQLMMHNTGYKNYFFYIPKFILKFIFFFTGKRDLAYSLVNDLQISNMKLKKTLDWHPPFSPKKYLYYKK